MAQTAPPDLNGLWLVTLGSSASAFRLQTVGKYGLSGQYEAVGYPPRLVTGSITSGSPNPNVLSVKLDVHGETATGTPWTQHWECYTATPDLLFGVTAIRVPGEVSGVDTHVPTGWTASRFKAVPMPPPAIVPSPESLKLDALAADVSKLQAMIQALLDQNAALTPALATP